ncbi:MAG: hypothetical protein LBE27_07150 [Deltaproteobacteria bacterium]|nr:hypothetical protein [Deltaproteobacteria bacterium]
MNFLRIHESMSTGLVTRTLVPLSSWKTCQDFLAKRNDVISPVSGSFTRG